MTNVIIAGTRTFNDYPLLEYEVKKFILENKLNSPLSIVCGMAQGADLLGKAFGEKYKIPIIEMPANWDKYGKVAGPIRNEEMAKIATHCIVFRKNQSKGSTDMIKTAKKYNLILKVIDL